MLLKFIELLKVLLLGMVEGISEWLPISSSGHMLLVDEFIKLDVSDAFKEMFFVIIQLGAILAVVILFWKKIFPFELKNKNEIIVKNEIMSIWKKIIISCIPGAVITLLFDNFIESHLHTPLVISLMLIFYGIVFILVESYNKKREIKINDMNSLTYKSALYIGLFQVLSIIPGTSRSGATIIGALLVGVDRVVASEFSFYLAIPAMFGLSFIKLLKFGFVFTSVELIILFIGAIVAFLVSLLVIKFLMNYIKKHDFKVFGIYRIILGIILMCYFVFF